MGTYTKYFEYTATHKEQARSVDMIAFLEEKEGFTFKRVGKEHKCVEHDSLVVMSDRKGWAWNSKGIYGASAIDYCMKIKDMTFRESMQAIVGTVDDKEWQTKLPMTKETKPAPQQPKAEFELPEKANNLKRAIAYLTKTRGIDNEIVLAFYRQGKIYQDGRNNVVFVGQDKNNKPVFACMRSTNTYLEKPFRGDCENSDKRYSFQMQGVKKSKVFVFESPIDLLSHATLANIATGNSNAWKQHSRLSLAGKSDVALEQYLADNKEVKEIALCLDNDVDGKNHDGLPCNHGQVAAIKLMEKYTKLGYNVSINTPRQKDFNDTLLEIRSAAVASTEKEQSHANNEMDR